MNRRKLVAAGAVLAVAAVVGGWAAFGRSEPSTDRPAAGADPAAVLVDAAAAVDRESYRLTVGSGTAGDGTVLVWDPRARRGLETTSLKVPAGEVKVERLVTGTDAYVRVSAPDRRVPEWDGRTWWQVPVDGGRGLDNTRLASTLRAPSGVRQTGDREYAGTLDLRGSADVLGEGVGAVLGDRAGAVPFTAALDERGRLVRYRIELAAEPGRAAALELTYADFGLPVSVEKPAAELVRDDPPANIPGV
ncbi:hypothetical protein Q3W71_04765 [Micromonospora sp. C28SCA-DRY-2]|uniref:hypothetical protein n=1 Tax=Micromonospora sp. C28SCA-DRY-2 TaxID=3059522 RepID=UPI00267540A1|nr:hypothetical protein [Micromonospora sp. C28SCA-DRY-2]MDO3700990.1 hypothetical protein [Micromonospora sp. C28SCA-DRY-2]